MPLLSHFASLAVLTAYLIKQGFEQVFPNGWLSDDMQISAHVTQDQHGWHVDYCG